jgi:HEAT repeat protein
MYTLACLLAVTVSTQDPAAAAALARAQRALPALTVQVQAAAAELARLDAVGAQSADLAALAQLWSMSDLSSLSGLATLVDLASLGTTLEALSDVPPSAWADDDPGDSLYRAARRLLNRGRYTEAADAFGALIRRFPRSDYTPDAYYWQAFALYKTGDANSYRDARRLLETQKSRHPRAATSGDAEGLYARIQGELARQGDDDAAQWVRVHAASAGLTPLTPPTHPTPPTPPTPPMPPTVGGRRGTQAGCPSDNDDDPRVAALNALLQMDDEAAVPILKQVLARRDPCSLVLRRKAVFIISQKRTSETEDILLASARTDPDTEVREQAVFWLSQVGSERAVSALDSILQSAADPEIQKKALFALSQISGARAGQILRDYAERSDAPEETREQAIFWLGQQHSAENAAFLRGLYEHMTSDDLREKVIFSLSQMGGAENARWLLDLAQNDREPVEMRKKALFWAGQTGASITDLAALYDHTSNDEIKEQLIFVYSQRNEPAAVEKLIDIAKRDGNPDLRKKAVFWLGQSHDPRARQALLDIINQ